MSRFCQLDYAVSVSATKPEAFVYFKTSHRTDESCNLRMTQFPAVDGSNLDGTPFMFPRDFTKRTIVLVAFDLKQRAAIESWLPFIDRYARAGHIDGRLFPAISRSMRMMKNMIVGTMRKGAPSAEARSATVPLFLDLDAFCQSLGIIDQAAIQLFVVDPGGNIVAHQAGAYEQAIATALEAHLA